MGWLLIPVLLVCAATAWAFIAAEPGVSNDACQRCGHDQGLDNTGRRCGNVDSYSGWGRDACLCVNDYHWNRESTTA